MLSYERTMTGSYAPKRTSLLRAGCVAPAGGGGARPRAEFISILYTKSKGPNSEALHKNPKILTTSLAAWCSVPLTSPVRVIVPLLTTQYLNSLVAHKKNIEQSQKV